MARGSYDVFIPLDSRLVFSTRTYAFSCEACSSTPANTSTDRFHVS